MSSKGWINKERVRDEEVLGIVKNDKGEILGESRSGIIVYSKTGSHIYPTIAIEGDSEVKQDEGKNEFV